MNVCPTCGKVFPTSQARCESDGAELAPWSASTSAESESNGLAAAARDARAQGARPHTESAMDTVTGARGEEDEAKTLVEFDPQSAIDAMSEERELDEPVELSEYAGRLLASGRYRLDRQIGNGGFGAVFEAFDKESQRRVAIKVLSPILSQDPRTLTRFRREALSASRVKHSGIVEVIDFGIEDHGVSYIVMEFLDGRDLEELLEDERKLEPERAVELIRQCAEALDCAHKSGVLHRDLKPANIFLHRGEGGREEVKILDFGIAKDDNANPRRRDLTSVTKVVGTPHYMSPEQARGKELDGRSDLYSLAIIFYEVLCGKRPFEGESVKDILMAHTKAPRVPPSSRLLAPRFDQQLDRLVMKAMEKHPSDRFADMRAFLDALNAYRNDANASVRGAKREAGFASSAVSGTAPEPLASIPSAAPAVHSSSPRPTATSPWQGPSKPAQPVSLAVVGSSRKVPRPIWWLSGLAAAGVIVFGINLATGNKGRESTQSPTAQPKTAADVARVDPSDEGEATAEGELVMDPVVLDSDDNRGATEKHAKPSAERRAHKGGSRKKRHTKRKNQRGPKRKNTRHR